LNLKSRIPQRSHHRWGLYGLDSHERISNVEELITVKNSKPDFPKDVQAPKEAPNILLILTDEVGFGALEITPVMVYFLYHDCV